MNNWYVFVGSDEYYNYGKIVHVTERFILVRLSSRPLPVTLIYHLKCLAHSEEVFFFETEAELNNWLNWLETPDTEAKAKFKVLNFKKDKS